MNLRLAGLLAGFLLIGGILVILNQKILERAAKVSATYPMGGTTIFVPRANWRLFSQGFEKLLLQLGNDPQYSQAATQLGELYKAIKPVSEP